MSSVYSFHRLSLGQSEAQWKWKALLGVVEHNWASRDGFWRHGTVALGRAHAEPGQPRPLDPGGKRERARESLSALKS